MASVIFAGKSFGRGEIVFDIGQACAGNRDYFHVRYASLNAKDIQAFIDPIKQWVIGHLTIGVENVDKLCSDDASQIVSDISSWVITAALYDALIEVGVNLVTGPLDIYLAGVEWKETVASLQAWTEQETWAALLEEFQGHSPCGQAYLAMKSVFVVSGAVIASKKIPGLEAPNPLDPIKVFKGLKLGKGLAKRLGKLTKTELDDFLKDFPDENARRAFNQQPELVESWKVLKEAGETGLSGRIKEEYMEQALQLKNYSNNY